MSSTIYTKLDELTLVLQTDSRSDETGFLDCGWTESEQLDLQKLNTKNPESCLKIWNFYNRHNKLAEFWLSAPQDKLQTSYSGRAGKAQKMLLTSGMRDEPLTDAEQREVEELSQYVAKGFEAPEAIQYLLAAMLYRRADQLPLQYDRTAVPQWFFNDLLEFMLYFPSYFQEIGEVENYCSYMQQLVDLVHSRVFSNPDSEIWRNLAPIFADTVNFVPLYFSTNNLKDVYTKRSDIL